MHRILNCAVILALLLLPKTALFAQSTALDFQPLKDAFKKREANLAIEHKEKLLGLKVKYSKRLDEIIVKLREAGDSEGAIVVSEAKKNIGEPLTDLEAAPRALIGAQSIYKEVETQLEAERDQRLFSLRRTYVQKLRLILTTQTGARNQVAATAIQQEIDRLPVFHDDSYDKGGGQHDKRVTKALRWLKEEQNADGSWGKIYPVAMTAFALLSFSGHGESVDSLEFGLTIVKAINYLCDSARKNNGYLGKAGSHLSYEHGIATYALFQAYALNQGTTTPTKPIKHALKNAVPVIINGQTEGGGWLYAYRANGIGDLSISGWNIQALKSAEMSGLPFTGLSDSIKKARSYIDKASTAKGLYRYMVREGDNGRLSLTGTGVLSARLLGEPMKNEDKSFPAILAYKPRSFRSTDIYAIYYHAQACYLKGNQAWRQFESNHIEMILAAQEADGSWPVAAGHMGAIAADSKIYSTCLCTLILETSYRAARWEK